MLNKLSFRLNYSEVEERLDPIFYFKKSNLDIVNKTTLPVFKLKEVINMQRGRFGHRPRNDPSFYDGDYPFIQTGDVVRANFGSSISYSQTLNEKGLKTSRLFSEPVVVLTIAANIGYTAILNYPACFPDSLIGLTSKNDLLELEYINIYISLIRQHIEDLAPQAAQKNINYQQLASIPVVVPSKVIQNKIIELWNTAQDLEKSKRKKAEEKLASIENYLLNRLGVTPSPNDPSLNARTFIRKFSDVIGDRLDPFYYKEKSNYNLSMCPYSIQRLGTMINYISTGLPIRADKRVERGAYPYYGANGIIGYMDQYTHSGRYLVMGQDGYIGNHYIAEGKFWASNHTWVINVIDSLKIDYLKNILDILNYQYLITGGVIPKITQSAVKKIFIPVPPLNIQEEIITYIQQIRDEAKKLEGEANLVLENAKQEIEKMILGGVV